MDKIDEAIIRLLEKNSRIPFSKIAKELGVTESTIRKRVKKLIKDGYIKKFTIEYGKINLITLVKIMPNVNVSYIGNKITNIENVRKVHLITGEYDFILLMTCKNAEEASKTIEKIRKIKGVQNTLSFFVLRSF